MAAPTDSPAPEAAEERLAPPMGEWLRHLETVRRYSPHTLAAYRRDLAALTALAGDFPPDRLSQGHLRRYLAQLHARGLQPRSLARMLACWRGYFQWRAPQAGLPANPAVGLRAPKAPRGLPKALSVEQAQALLEHAPPTAHGPEADAARCDRAMFELFYSSGLRLSELTGLDWRYVSTPGHVSAGWLDLDAAEVSVLGKGGKRRAVPVGTQAVEALRAWLAVRDGRLSPAAGEDDRCALFLGARGRRIGPRAVQLRLQAWAARAGVPTHVHPHVLRHSFASHVLQSAQDLRAVQEMLGHASISTTQIYTRLDFQHLAAVYDKAHPRAGRKAHPLGADMKAHPLGADAPPPQGGDAGGPAEPDPPHPGG